MFINECSLETTAVRSSVSVDKIDLEADGIDDGMSFKVPLLFTATVV